MDKERKETTITSGLKSSPGIKLFPKRCIKNSQRSRRGFFVEHYHHSVPLNISRKPRLHQAAPHPITSFKITVTESTEQRKDSPTSLTVLVELRGSDRHHAPHVLRYMLVPTFKGETHLPEVRRVHGEGGDSHTSGPTLGWIQGSLRIESLKIAPILQCPFHTIQTNKQKKYSTECPTIYPFYLIWDNSYGRNNSQWSVLRQSTFHCC